MQGGSGGRHGKRLMPGCRPPTESTPPRMAGRGALLVHCIARASTHARMQEPRAVAYGEANTFVTWEKDCLSAFLRPPSHSFLTSVLHQLCQETPCTPVVDLLGGKGSIGGGRGIEA